MIIDTIKLLILILFSLLGLIFYDIFKKPKCNITKPEVSDVEITETPTTPAETLGGNPINLNIIDETTNAIKPGKRKWTGVSISNDGKLITAVAYNSKIITTKNALEEDIDKILWNEEGNINDWVNVAMSYDGSTQAAIPKFGNISYYEEDDGNWTDIVLPKNWTDITMDYDGELIIACENDGLIGGNIWKIDTTSFTEPIITKITFPSNLGSSEKKWLKVKTNVNHNYTIAMTSKQIFFNTNIDLNESYWYELKLPNNIQIEKINFVDCAISSGRSDPIIYVADNISNGSTGNIFKYEFIKFDYKLVKVDEIPPYNFSCINTNYDGSKIAACIYNGDLLFYSYNLRKFNIYIKSEYSVPNIQELNKINKNSLKLINTGKNITSCSINNNSGYKNIDSKYQVYLDYDGSLYLSKNTGYSFIEFET